MMKNFRYSRLSTVGIYGTMLLLLIGIATGLVFDLAAGRERIIQEKKALAVQQSQFLSQWFGTTIVSADYVLRGILDKISAQEVAGSANDLKTAQKFAPWLDKKRNTVPGVIGLGLYDELCVYRLAADTTKVGFKSNFSFCANPSITIRDQTYIEYVPADKSLSNNPAILVSRPRISEDGRFLGGAMAIFHLEELQGWLQSIELSGHDMLAVVDREGLILALNPAQPSSFGKHFISGEEMPSIGEERSSSSLIARSLLDGREHICGLSKIENIPLLCIVGFDLDDSLLEWRKRAWEIAGGFAGMLLLYSLALRAHLITVRQWYEMSDLAETDPLTGLANRRRLVLDGERELSRCQRNNGQMSLAMVDIDRFKSINDRWGHPTGDRVIQALANAMTASARKQDVVGRIGGEEFVIILAETDWQGASIKAEKLRETVQNEASALSDDKQTVRFAISIGVATLGSEDKSFADLLARADKALYMAKNNGRNQVVAL